MKAFAFAGPSFREIIRDRADVVSLDGIGIEVGGNQVREWSRLGDLSGEHQWNWSEIIEKVRRFMPMWVRYAKRGDKLELFLMQAAFAVLVVAQQLREYEVEEVYFHTGSAHHPDSMVISIACELVGSRKIFLYPEVFAGRLLPLEEKQTFEARTPLKTGASSFGYSEVLARFLEANLQGSHPKSSMGYASSRVNVVSSYLKASLIDANRIRRSVWRTSSKKDKSLLSELTSTYPFGELIQLRDHRKAIGYFNKLGTMGVACARDAISSRNSVTLVSHFQPESTTFPEGGVHWNQVSLVRTMRERGFVGRILYKEHPAIYNSFSGRMPTHVAVARENSYYEQLTALGCEFLPSTVLQPGSADQSKAKVLTIAGTIALERGLAGFRTVVAGNPWFKELPAIVSLDAIFDGSIFEEAALEQSLADASRGFLLETLDNNTINNPDSVGTLGMSPQGANEGNLRDQIDVLLG